jgi:hypothetical protein
MASTSHDPFESKRGIKTAITAIFEFGFSNVRDNMRAQFYSIAFAVWCGADTPLQVHEEKEWIITTGSQQIVQ